MVLINILMELINFIFLEAHLLHMFFDVMAF